jgi:hypothetical protein
MRGKNVLVVLLSIIVVAALTSSSWATVVGWGYPQLELANPLIGPQTQFAPATSAIPYLPPAEPKGSPLGQTFLLGTTWYDYQHNGTIEKMVHLTEARGVHFCWMNGLQAQATERHIYYNYFTPAGNVNWPDVGYQVDQGNRAGYSTCTGLGGGEAVIAYHSTETAGGDFNTQVAYDFLEGFGAFQTTDIPNLPGWNETIWPHATVCSQNYIHVASCENRTTSWQRIAYSRSEDGGVTYTGWATIDTILTISQCVAASPVSNKVGIAYTKSQFDPLNLGPYDGLLVSQLNNGIALIESDDGVTWNFTDRKDITNFVEPDSSRYPDSSWANGDTLRCYCDVSLFYDQNDYAHAAFTTRYLGFDARLAAHPDSFAISGMSLDASQIWHWSEQHDTLTRIADGWYDVGDPDVGANEYRGSGAWRSTVDRPSLGQDPATGYLYCTYVRCPEGDTSGGPIPSHGFANGEIYCSVSTDGGLNWSEGTNLTNTPSIGAFPGNCMDEDYSSLAAEVNDTLHIMYIEDKDAGGVVQTAPQEGTWTQNPVKYLKVPADLVPPGPPFVANFDFHVNENSPYPTAVEPQLVDGAVPQAFALHQNYPNPFNPETTIRFEAAQTGPVSLSIYNVTGQLVRELTDGHREAGTYQVRWNGRNDDGQPVPSGIYFCRMKAGTFSATRKLALIK